MATETQLSTVVDCRIDKDTVACLVIDTGESDVLTNLTHSVLKTIRHLFENAGHIICILDGDVGLSMQDESGMWVGLLRTMKLEYSSTRFSILGIDKTELYIECKISGALNSVIQESMSMKIDVDSEWKFRAGVLHASRFEPEKQKSERLSQSITSKPAPAGDSDGPNFLQLDIRQVGNFKSLFWKELEEVRPCASGEVEVDVKVIGVNAKVRVAECEGLTLGSS